MRIAVLLDGSETSEQALPYALALRESDEDELLLMQAIGVSLISDLALSNAMEASHGLTGLARGLRSRGVRCGTRVLCGPRLPSLVGALQEGHVQLAVVCAPLRRGWSRWLHKSMSRMLGSSSPCPVLVVRPGEKSWQPRRALVALDGSTYAEKAVDRALEVLRGKPAQLLMVAATGSLASQPGDPDFALREAQMARLNAYLTTRTRELENPDLIVGWRLEDGPAADSLLEWADRERADFIALATRGPDGLVSWLAGSVARSLLDRSRHPLLLVTPQSSSTS